MNLESMLKRNAYLLPPTTEQALELLNGLKRDGRTAPSTPGRWVRTLVYLANTFGFDIEASALDRKRDAVVARMDKRVRKKTKRARALTLAACEALENAAKHANSSADAYAAGHFRVLLGSSAWWDDGQHTDPTTLEDTLGAVTYEPWQQKNLDRTMTPAKMIAMTAPKRSFARDAD
jgi:hypothetical protein